MQMKLVTTQTQLQKNSIYQPQQDYSIRQFDPLDLFQFEQFVEQSHVLNSTNLIEYLYNIIDWYIITMFGKLNEDTIKLVKSKLLTFFLNNATPNDDSIKQYLYMQNYNNIMYPIYYENFNDPYIPNDYETRKVLEQSSKTTAINERDLQYEYLLTAIAFIKQLDNHITLDIDKYIKLINNEPEIARQNAITQATKDILTPITTRKPRMDMKLLITDTIRYIKNLSEFQSIQYANQLALEYGHNEPYISKTWIWSGKKNTRHRNMDKTTIPVNEPFQVLNERTGETCTLMFPKDYKRDPTGANTSNCGCGITYNTQKTTQRTQ